MKQLLRFVAVTLAVCNFSSEAKANNSWSAGPLDAGNPDTGIQCHAGFTYVADHGTYVTFHYYAYADNTAGHNVQPYIGLFGGYPTGGANVDIPYGTYNPVFHRGPGGNDFTAPANAGTGAFVVGPYTPPTYSVDFPLPPNTTGKGIYWFVRHDQGAGISLGNIVAAYFQPAGEGASTIHVTGLPDNGPCQLYQQTSGYVEEDASGNYIGPLPDVLAPVPTNTRSVSVGTPIAPGTTPTESPVAVSQNPTLAISKTPDAPKITPPTPVAPAPAPTPTPAPTPNTPIGIPSPLSVPFDTGATSDTSAAKTKDIATLGNTLSAAISSHMTADNTNANALVTAINSHAQATVDTGNATTKAINDNATVTVTAINKVADEANKNANGIITAVNDLKASVESNDPVATLVGAGKGFDTAGTLSQGSTQQASTPGYSGPSLSGNVTVHGTGGTLGELGNTDIGGHTISLSLLPTAQWSGADTLLKACRNLILLALVVWFTWECSKVLNTYVAALPQIPQADSNVGVENFAPGVSQGKTWASASIIVLTFMGTAASILAVLNAWLSSQGFGISSLFSSVDLGGLGTALTLLDQYMQCFAIVQFAILRAGISFVIGPIYLAAGSVIKFAKA